MVMARVTSFGFSPGHVVTVTMTTLQISSDETSRSEYIALSFSFETSIVVDFSRNLLG
jgi:hypothetical protein